jgi:Ca2+-transporting ATPase
MNSLLKDYNLVRKADTCMTIGAVNYICTDKTGILTQNKLGIAKVFDGTNTIETSHFQDGNFRERPNLIFSDGIYELFKLNSACNTSTEVNFINFSFSQMGRKPQIQKMI